MDGSTAAGVDGAQEQLWEATFKSFDGGEKMSNAQKQPGSRVRGVDDGQPRRRLRDVPVLRRNRKSIEKMEEPR